MVVKIQFPEPVAQEVLQLPNPDAFVSSAVARALELLRSPTRPRGAGRTAAKLREEPPVLPLSDRKREDAWRRSNQDLLLGHFAGQWVVLEGEEIMAHDKDPAKAVKEARAKGVAVPFVFYVETPRKPGVVRIGL